MSLIKYEDVTHTKLIYHTTEVKANILTNPEVWHCLFNADHKEPNATHQGQTWNHYGQKDNLENIILA